MLGTLVLSALLLFGLQSEKELERYAQQGQAALAEKRYGEAERAYEKLRELSPNTAEVHGTLGFIYYQERKFEQAVPTLRQALKLKPGLPNADTLLAMSLSELGHYQEALPGLEKGFHKSQDPALRRMSGLQLQRAYTGLQRDTKAVEVALELNRLFPNDPEVLFHAGRVYGNLAFLTMVKLSKVAPDSVWTREAVAEAYESQGSYEHAVEEYRAVLALDPSRPGIHYRLGRTLMARVQKITPGEAVPEAMKEFEQELQIDPTNANAAYELGEAYRKSGQFDKAENYFNAALKHYPDFEEARLGLGRLLFALGKPAQALPHLQKASALNPENEVTEYQLSQVYGALGQTAEQQKAFSEFRRIQRQKAAEPKGLLSPREVTKQELDPSAGK